MFLHLRGIMAIWVALLVGASWSACCCQSDWFVREGARLLAGDTTDIEGCACCEAKRDAQKEQQNTPRRGRECTPSIAKTVPSGPVQASDVVATGWVWVEVGAEPSRAGVFGMPAVECRGAGWVTGTLLGLGCALVV